MNKLLVLLSMATVAVWLAVFSVKDNLSIIACNVGQGDAILIQKVSTQILVDSGPNNSVLDCLGRHMPFWDRKIELVILTHTDKDHSGGLVDVLKRYNVINLLTNDLDTELFSGNYVEVLRKEVGSRNISIIPASGGVVLRVGMIYLDILHPLESFKSNKTNDYSIVNLLTYGGFKAIFTGDIEDRISDKVAENFKIQQVDYIKIPHHGSKNGLSEKLLQALMPKLAVISLGKNSYGHPHKEVMDLLESYKIKVLRTDELGDVEVVTDGKSYWIKN